MALDQWLYVGAIAFSGFNTLAVAKLIFKAGELVQELRDYGRRLEAIEAKQNEFERELQELRRIVPLSCRLGVSTGWGKEDKTS